VTTTSQYDLERDYDAAEREYRGAGWIAFASAILAFAGTFNLIDGIVALARSKFYVADATYVFSDLRTWGWIVLVLGVGQLLAAFAVYTGSSFARWFGISVAGLNGLAQLMFIQAYPWWALVAFTLDILVIYALAVYGGSSSRSAVR
jgi:hypothetical protein